MQQFLYDVLYTMNYLSFRLEIWYLGKLMDSRTQVIVFTSEGQMRQEA